MSGGTWPPTLADLQGVLKDDVLGEPTVQAAALVAAMAVVLGDIGRVVDIQAFTQIDSGETGRLWESPRSITLDQAPIDLTQPVTITDANGNVTDPSTYTVHRTSGVVRILPMADARFGTPPYTVTYFAGLAAHPNWTTFGGTTPGLQSIAWQAVIDTAADFLANRAPSIKSESSGGGVMVTTDDVEIPARTKRLLALLRRAGTGT